MQFSLTSHCAEPEAALGLTIRLTPMGPRSASSGEAGHTPSGAPAPRATTSESDMDVEKSGES